MKTFDLTPVSNATVAASKFLRLRKKHRQNIKAVSIIPPSLGRLSDNDFGSIVIEYKTPVYKVSSR